MPPTLYEVGMLRENDQKARASCQCGGFDIIGSPGETFNLSSQHILEAHGGHGGVKILKETYEPELIDP